MNITRSQLRRSKFDVSSDRRTKPTVSSDYVVGLTDGEGCFYVNTTPLKRYRAGVFVGLHFYIKLNARDKDVLEQVRDALGCGAVYFQKEIRANHAQCYRYSVSSSRDIIEKIIPFFNEHQLQTASKRE